MDDSTSLTSYELSLWTDDKSQARYTFRTAFKVVHVHKGTKQCFLNIIRRIFRLSASEQKVKCHLSMRITLGVSDPFSSPWRLAL